MTDKKYFCYEIYKNLAIWSHNGQLGYNPCSFFKGYIQTADTFDLDRVWNSPEHNQLKFNVENDIPIAGCEACYSAECNGLESRRLGAKRLYEEFHQDTNIDTSRGPQGLDYSVGNLCNLKCVICGPENSTKWIPDYEKMYPLHSVENFQYDKFNQLEVHNTELLQNIKSVHFHGGGEPFLTENHLRLLQKIKQAKGLADVRVFYNTNGTQRVSGEILELWEECKLIELYFSVDDVGARFNYQRTGADWTEVVDNLQWYYNNMPHNHMFNINCVWGYLNLFYLNELTDWYQQNFATNRYGDPTNLIFQQAIGNYKITHWSQEAQSSSAKKFENHPELIKLINTLSISDNPHDHFWNTISQLDNIRNTDFKTLCPEWSKLL
jgi:organic radical activating enzyme